MMLLARLSTVLFVFFLISCYVCVLTLALRSQGMFLSCFPLNRLTMGAEVKLLCLGGLISFLFKSALF